VWPVTSRGGSRDASQQESRQRGKLPAEFNAELELQIEQKYLPPYLKATHDWRDDGQDQVQGVNRDIRARNRERDLGDGSITIRVSREQMIEAGDTTREQFASMELEAGRLEDGRPVSILFYSKDDAFERLLGLGVDDPTNVLTNDPETMIGSIEEARVRALKELAVSTSNRKRERIRQALAALDWLQQEYEDEVIIGQFESSNEESEDETEAVQPEEAADAAAAAEEQGQEQSGGPREPDQVREGTVDKALLRKQGEDLELRIEELREELQRALEDDEDDDTIEKLVAALFLGIFLTGTGLEPDALTSGDAEAIDTEVDRFMLSLPKMRDRVGRIDLDPTLDRVGSQASNLYWQGEVKYGEPEELLVWAVGSTANHCGTCGGLDGEVRTRKEWYDHGPLPQAADLECTGKYCQCGLYSVGETPGFFIGEEQFLG